jgi:hypothetical protein
MGTCRDIPPPAHQAKTVAPYHNPRSPYFCRHTITFHTHTSHTTCHAPSPKHKSSRSASTHTTGTAPSLHSLSTTRTPGQRHRPVRSMPHRNGHDCPYLRCCCKGSVASNERGGQWRTLAIAPKCTRHTTPHTTLALQCFAHECVAKNRRRLCALAGRYACVCKR